MTRSSSSSKSGATPPPAGGGGFRFKITNLVGRIRRMPTHYKVLFLGQSAIMLFALTVRITDIGRAKAIQAAKKEAAEKEGAGKAETDAAGAAGN